MKNSQYILVMTKGQTQEEFGMNKGYSIDILGAKKAMEMAQAYIEEQSSIFRNIEFKLVGGEW